MRSRLALSALALSLSTFLTAGVHAAQVNVSALGQQGWGSDDTRDTSGTNLLGSNTNAPASSGTFDDNAINSQIQFVDGPAGSTYGGAVSIDGTSGNSGKSSISVINNSGFAAASTLTSTSFTATYDWNDLPNPTPRSLAFKIGIQSTEFGSGAGQSQNGYTTGQRSGESVWDLVLVYTPPASNNVWSTTTVTHNTGTWNLFRQTNNTFFPAPNNADDVNGNPTKTLDDWANDPTFGSLLFGAGAEITSIQFGLGSSQKSSIAYLDYVQTNLLNGGDVVNFAAVPEPASLSLIGGLGLFALARRRRTA